MDVEQVPRSQEAMLFVGKTFSGAEMKKIWQPCFLWWLVKPRILQTDGVVDGEIQLKSAKFRIGRKPRDPAFNLARLAR